MFLGVGWIARPGCVTARANGDAEIPFQIQELVTWTTGYPPTTGESTPNERNPGIKSKGFDIDWCFYSISKDSVCVDFLHNYVILGPLCPGQLSTVAWLSK